MYIKVSINCDLWSSWWGNRTIRRYWNQYFYHHHDVKWHSWSKLCWAINSSMLVLSCWLVLCVNVLMILLQCHHILHHFWIWIVHDGLGGGSCHHHHHHKPNLIIIWLSTAIYYGCSNVGIGRNFAESKGIICHSEAQSLLSKHVNMKTDFPNRLSQKHAFWFIVLCMFECLMPSLLSSIFLFRYHYW